MVRTKSNCYGLRNKNKAKLARIRGLSWMLRQSDWFGMFVSCSANAHCRVDTDTEFKVKHSLANLISMCLLWVVHGVMVCQSLELASRKVIFLKTGFTQYQSRRPLEESQPWRLESWKSISFSFSNYGTSIVSPKIYSFSLALDMTMVKYLNFILNIETSANIVPTLRLVQV